MKQNRRFRREVEKAKSKFVKSNWISLNEPIKRLQKVLEPYGFNLEKDQMLTLTLNGIKTYKFCNGVIREDNVYKVALIPNSNNGVELAMLEVKNQFRGLGFGGTMLDFLLIKMREKLTPHVTLFPMTSDPSNNNHLGSNNLALEEFYSRRGFEWNKKKTEMVLNWEKFSQYEVQNKVEENLDYSKIYFSLRNHTYMVA